VRFVDPGCLHSVPLLGITGLLVLPAVIGYPSEGTFGAPQTIPVADHGPAVTSITPWIETVHVLRIGNDPSRLGSRFTWHQQN